MQTSGDFIRLKHRIYVPDFAGTVKREGVLLKEQRNGFCWLEPALRRFFLFDPAVQKDQMRGTDRR